MTDKEKRLSREEKREEEIESRNLDIRNINIAIQYLEYLINPSSDGISFVPIISGHDDKDTECHSRLFSSNITNLSVKSGSITDQYSEIPWDFLRNIYKVASDKKNLAVLREDFQVIKKALKEIVKKEKTPDLQLSEDDYGMVNLYGTPGLDSEYEKQISEKDVIESRYEELLFQGVSRNKFGEHLVLPELEKSLFSFYVQDTHKKLSGLMVNLDKLESGEAILAITTLSGELSKNILLFKRYILEQYTPIFHKVKRLRDAIGHMADYESTNEYLLQQKEKPEFIKELVMLNKQVVKYLELLPIEVKRQVTVPSQKDQKRADKAIEAIKRSLPEKLLGNEAIQRKLDFIRRAILKEFEYREKVASDTATIFGDNMVSFLKDGCEELDAWKGVKTGILYNLELKSNEIKRRNIKSIQVKSEVSKVMRTAEPLIKDYDKIRIIKSRKPESVAPKTLIEKFIAEYKAAKKKHGKRSSSLEMQFKIVTDSLSTINALTESLTKENSGKGQSIRKAAREDESYHHAVLFNLTLIGQAIQNLRGKDKFKHFGSLTLKKEFENLRQIRNSIAHDQYLDDGDSTLSYYGNDLMLSPIQLDGGKAYDSADYLSSMQLMIDGTLKAIKEGEGKVLTSDEKRSLDSQYQEYLMTELLGKAEEFSNNDSCLDILLRINYTIEDEERFCIRTQQHLNDVYYQKILINDLRIACENKDSFVEYENCDIFLQESGINTDRECKESGNYFDLAHQINLEKCKETLSKLEIDTNKYKKDKDLFEAANKIVPQNKSPRKDDVQVQLEKMSRYSRDPESYEILLGELNIKANDRYKWIDSCLQIIKSKLYKKGCNPGGSYISINLESKADNSRPEEFFNSDSFEGTNQSLEDFKTIKEAELSGNKKILTGMIRKYKKLLDIHADTQNYLGQESAIDVEGLYAHKEKMEAICKTHNVTIDAIGGKLYKHSWSHPSQSFFLIESDDADNIAHFKKDLCKLFGMRLRIVTKNDLYEYFEEKGRPDKFANKLASLKKNKLQNLQNGYELHEAVKNRDVDTIRKILQTKEPAPFINIKIGMYTPLHLACMDYSRGIKVDKSYEIVELLLKSGADPKIQDKHGNNMLHNATLDGEMGLIKLAIEFKTPIESKNKYGESALEMSSYADNKQEVRDYLSPLINPKLDEVTKLIIAIRYGDVPSVKSLLTSIDVNQKTPDGDLLLNIACDSLGHERENKFEIVKLIIDAGADVNAVDNDGHNAIYATLEEIDPEAYQILELLIKKNVEITDAALRKSVYFPNPRIMKLLLDNKANPDDDDTISQLLNIRFGQSKRLRVIDKLQIMIDSGMDLSLEDDEIGNILHMAANKGREDVVKLLLNNKADKTIKSTAKDFEGKTAAEIARSQGFEDLANMIDNHKVPDARLQSAEPSVHPSSSEVNLLIKPKSHQIP